MQNQETLFLKIDGLDVMSLLKIPQSMVITDIVKRIKEQVSEEKTKNNRKNLLKHLNTQN